jgi:7-cyano-7-deazaguanine synthase
MRRQWLKKSYERSQFLEYKYAMSLLKKQAVVVHSGGMDSSLCLAHAIQQHGRENVLSISFSYQQRHSNELEKAKAICQNWKVDHTILDISCLSQITENSLTRSAMPIVHRPGEAPNSLVVGRNGLMARIAAIHAHHLGAHCIYMGVIEIESANSGYRDCSRSYMDKIQEILCIDLDDPSFEIRTPVVFMSKKQTLEFGMQMGVLEYLLENTLSCYNGIEKAGCKVCPACILRNEGIMEFLQEYPDLRVSYKADL